MASFIRQEALVGDSPYRTLLCGSDSQSKTPGDIIRLYDSDLIKVAGVYTSGHDAKFTPTSRGRRIQALKISSQRTLVFNFVCGDTTGFEQSAIKAFFTYDRKIVYSDNERKIANTALWVQSIDDSYYYDGSDGIAITCSAEYDDINSSREVNIYSYEGTTWPTISQEITNPLSVDGSVRLSIGTTDGSTAKFHNTSITLASTSDDGNANGSIKYIIGINGVDSSYTGAAVVMDSEDELISGKAIIDPSSSQKFFIIPPFATATITATMSGTFPLEQATAISLSMFFTAPQGMYSNDFSISDNQ